MGKNDLDTSQWVAVIGMSGRFPGARDVEQFWDNLIQGRDSIARLDRDALLRAGVGPQLLDRPEYVPAAARLDDIDQFDASFFGISPREAKELAPAMRLFLECAWEAFENAGHAPGARDASVGVFAGANMSNYWRLKSGALEPDLEEILGNDKDYLATHVSYKLNLTGPSISVQTACSTSLVAVHMACQALLGQQCDLALAGGGAVRIPHETGYLREEGSILSPDGRCRPFDAAESGPVFGSGVGVVLLKRYGTSSRR
jgi:acyl transferase domain-containing protein